MIKILKKNERWKDYFNLKEDEVKLSLLLAIMFLILFLQCDFFVNINNYLGLIKDVLLYTAAGALGLIGVSLSGVAIITALFSKKQVEKIERYNGSGSFERMMSSFLFLAFNCALLFGFCMMLVILSQSDLPAPDENILMLVVFVTIYFILFDIFYTVSLVGNCIKIFDIRNTYGEIKEKDFFAIANEIRIDLVILTILKKYKISEDEFLEELKKAVEHSEINCKQEMMEYFYKYYLGKSEVNYLNDK